MFLKRVWVKVTYLVEWLSLFPGQGPGDFQTPLLGESDGQHLGHPHFPIFKPPGGRLEGPGSEFECQYPNMPGYRSCSTPEDRSCWLVNDKTGDRFNITTDYEQRAPNGTDRYYQLYLNNDTINANGQWFREAKLFNSSLPGPWIQACWGDRVFINVINNLTTNGTSVHWHGLRQNQTMHMDGVNGVTQCPIAPNDSFVYILNTTQYGSSWYHTHYSVQYADGAQGPITIHGPASAPFDEPKLPLLMTDWSNNSAFQAIYPASGGLTGRSILLNGTGDINRFSGAIENTTTIPPIYTLHFEPKSKTLPILKRAKKYLLRLINTSYDSTFVFSIDNHMLTVVENDFVPVKNFTVSHLTIGIGSRYHVVVEADPVSYDSTKPPPTDTEYWIRTHVLSDCGQGKAGRGVNYSQTGILRYDNSSTADPTTKSWFNGTASLPKCGDEPIGSLHPCVNWTVTGPSNNNSQGEVYDMAFTADHPYAFSLGELSFEKPDSTKVTPFQIDYGDPIFLHLDEYERPWPAPWVVIPENFTSNDWIILVLNNPIFGSHPIHLHGHDFAVLYQGNEGPLTLESLTDPKIVQFPVVNPARRDVVLLPEGGAVVIAFKSDNPGNWLMHCHIAFHASNGLALQILERQADANVIWPHGQSKALKEAARVCNNWNDWVGDCNNWWNGSYSCSDGKDRIHFFGDDSGI